MDVTARLKKVRTLSAHLTSRLEACDICPRNCGVNRLAGARGRCGIGNHASVFTYFLHHGEEPALSGGEGSGTIFFSGCNLGCCYCQNHRFSHSQEGDGFGADGLASLMLKLQEQSAHNINLVTPTHVLPHILEALWRALEQGLTVPVIYNTSGYEKPEIIESLEGIVDVYLADAKYCTDTLGKRYSDAPDYPAQNKDSLRVMYQQTAVEWHGDLLVRGLVVRHLVMPGCIEDTKCILSWLKRNCPDALVSVMFQYQPYFNASRFPEINRCLTRQEYAAVVAFVSDIDLHGWVQEFSPPDTLAGVYFPPSLEI